MGDMEYTTGRNEIFLRYKTQASINMDAHTINTLRCFIGEALDNDVWEDFPDDQALIRELHDAMVFNHRPNSSVRVASKTTWGRSLERHLEAHREEVEDVWENLDSDT